MSGFHNIKNSATSHGNNSNNTNSNLNQVNSNSGSSSHNNNNNNNNNNINLNTTTTNTTTNTTNTNNNNNNNSNNNNNHNTNHNNNNNTNNNTSNNRIHGRKVIKKSKYSRLGCLNCKQRRLKCGEELDSCFNCLDKNICCSYLDLTPAQRQKIIDSNANKDKSQKTGPGGTGLMHFKDLKTELDNFSYGVSRFKVSTGSNHSNEYFNNYGSNNGTNAGSVAGSVGTSSASGAANATSPNSGSSSITDSSGRFRKLDTTEPSMDTVGDIITNSTFGIIDFKSNKHTNTNSTDFKAEDHPINHAKRNFDPLPNHLYQLTSFKLYKVKTAMYPTEYTSRELFTVCGEDDIVQAYVRDIMSVWYTDFLACASASPLIFNAMISRSLLIVLVNIQKACYRKDGYQETSNLLKRLFLPYKLRGLRYAQMTIDSLNQPKFTSNYKYLKLFKNLVHYSLINIGLTLQSDKDYLSLIAFMNGFLSSSLSTEMFDKVRRALERQFDKRPKVHAEFVFTEKLFSYIRVFFLKNIGAIYIPGYVFDPLLEFYYELNQFRSLVKRKNLSRNHVAVSQLDDLKRFMEVKILSNGELRNSHDPNHVTEYNIGQIFDILIAFFDDHPSEVVFFQSFYKSMTTIDKIIYLHWMTLSFMLDNVFPEALYFFTAKFSGGILWAGFDMKLVQSILDGLETEYKVKDYALYEQLYRRTIYLTRAISFFAYRYRTYFRNLIITNPYPSSPLFHQKLRFNSRKPRYVKETQLKSLKRGAIKFEHYPVNDPSYIQIDSELERASPGNPNNVCYVDNNMHINENVDENFYRVRNCLKPASTINSGLGGISDINDSDGLAAAVAVEESEFNIDLFPIELMKLSPYGLIKNIDFRPNLNTVRNNYLNEDFEYQNPEEILKNYTIDKDEILNNK